MKAVGLHGVYEDRGLLWTVNRVPGTKVYGELLRSRGDREYRAWSPWRSKLAALARRMPSTPWFRPRDTVLYLGAASGTTCSHLSDLLDSGRVIAVEFSPRSMRDLLWNAEPRENLVPVLEDASHPERYVAYLERPADALVQDVAQRHQVDIFLRNLALVKPGGLGFLFVKARSINVSAVLSEVYGEVARRLKEANVEVLVQVDLDPFEKDHRAFVVRAPGAR